MRSHYEPGQRPADIQNRLAALAVGLMLTMALASHTIAAVETTTTLTAEKKGETMKTEKALFAAGCFWGVEAAFRQQKGVISTTVGYSGGHTKNPTYKDVCAGDTGHAETAEVEYDPSQVSYQQLVDLFFENHDPTTMNRQGPDVGEQYRSAIFYLSPEQEKIARETKAKLDASGKFRRPIVTEITKAGEFWRAEDYHQQYLEKRGLASCHVGVKH